MPWKSLKKEGKVIQGIFNFWKRELSAGIGNGSRTGSGRPSLTGWIECKGVCH
jgi:hypothetical protein